MRAYQLVIHFKFKASEIVKEIIDEMHLIENERFVCNLLSSNSLLEYIYYKL
jgi:hypothetical protein